MFNACGNQREADRLYPCTLSSCSLSEPPLRDIQPLDAQFKLHMKTTAKVKFEHVCHSLMSVVLW
jgi:hypothetical protein